MFFQVWICYWYLVIFVIGCVESHIKFSDSNSSLMINLFSKENVNVKTTPYLFSFVWVLYCFSFLFLSFTDWIIAGTHLFPNILIFFFRNKNQNVRECRCVSSRKHEDTCCFETDFWLLRLSVILESWFTEILKL